MRWNLKEAEIGTKRTVKQFAFWPTRLSDGNTVVWLESYLKDLAYHEYGYGRPYAWIVLRRYLG